MKHYISGDIRSKTNTRLISNTECQKWAQIERLGFWVKVDSENYNQHLYINLACLSVWVSVS